MRVLLLILGLFSSTMLWAQDSPQSSGGEPLRTSVPEIVRQMVSLGYHDINEVEWDMDEEKFEAEAKDAAGKNVEVEFSLSGEVIDVEYE